MILFLLVQLINARSLSQLKIRHQFIRISIASHLIPWYPQPIIQQMGNMQQYTFVCAPSMAQYGVIAAMDCDTSPQVNDYRRKRDLVAAELSGRFEFAKPCGGFFLFLKVPPQYGSSTQFVEAALEKNLLCVPGNVFSEQDTHFRISYATDDERIRRGCEILKSM